MRFLIISNNPSKFPADATIIFANRVHEVIRMLKIKSSYISLRPSSVLTINKFLDLILNKEDLAIYAVDTKPKLLFPISTIVRKLPLISKYKNITIMYSPFNRMIYKSPAFFKLIRNVDIFLISSHLLLKNISKIDFAKVKPIVPPVNEHVFNRFSVKNAKLLLKIVRNDYGEFENRILVGLIGKCEQRRGFHTIPQILKKLKKRLTKRIALIVALMPLKSRESKVYYENLISKILHLSHYQGIPIKVLGGMLPDISIVYNIVDIVILPFLSNGNWIRPAYTILEAMMAGNVVITTNHFDLSLGSILKNYKTGFVTIPPNKDYYSFINSTMEYLEQMVLDHNERMRICMNARNISLKTFSYKTFGSMLKKLLREYNYII